MKSVVVESVLTCPHCGFAKQETMPTDGLLEAALTRLEPASGMEAGQGQ